MSLPEYTIFNDRQGAGYICKNEYDICKILINRYFTIGGWPIHISEFTDLKGFFSFPVQFKGFNKESTKAAIFYIGENNGLFYYREIFILSENRIFSMYGPNYGRDFLLVENEWK